VRYSLSIAIYVLVVAGAMAIAAAAGEGGGAIVLLGLVALQPAVGFAIGRWWAILLVSLLPILAIPVPRPEDAYEPFPMWFTMLSVGVPAGEILIAAGVAVRKVSAQR